MKLGLREFSQQLLDAGDLDPVYTLLWEAQLDRETLEKWLLSYWCFYHVGTASVLASCKVYWHAMREAAAGKHFPRCHERRHFRGENARKSVEFLEEQGLDTLFGEFRRAAYEQRGLTCYEVFDYVQEWVGFGPWISFKVADMLERLDLLRVDFDMDAVFSLYDSPRKGAVLSFQNTFARDPKSSEAEPWAVAEVLDALGSRKAPPRFERPCNVQEAETCLCKWHSYMHGKYHIGEDVAACRRGLLRFAKTRLAQSLLRAGAKGGLWE